MKKLMNKYLNDKIQKTPITLITHLNNQISTPINNIHITFNQIIRLYNPFTIIYNNPYHKIWSDLQITSKLKAQSKLP